MVESANVGRHLGSYRTTFRVDHHIKRLDADLAEHRTQQRCFVLAVSVVVHEHIGCGMRLKSSNAELDGYVADVMLDELCQRFHFLQGSTRRSSKSGDLLRDLRRRGAAAIGQFEVPIPHLLPTGKTVGGSTAWRKERNNHLASHTVDRRHLGFFANL